MVIIESINRISIGGRGRSGRVERERVEERVEEEGERGGKGERVKQ